MIGASILALVPARGGSKRVPGKNARMLGDRPLIEWTFAAARCSTSLDRILLSSDDPALIAIGQASERIETLQRPAELASDTAGSVDVALHALATERKAGRDWDVLVLLQPTSPFRAKNRIDQGIAMLANADAPAVVGVAPVPVHPEHLFYVDRDGKLVRAVADAAAHGKRTQELPQAFSLTGSFFAIRSEALSGSRTFVPTGSLPLICDAPGEDIDIDTEQDFARAAAFLRTAAAEPTR